MRHQVAQDAILDAVVGALAAQVGLDPGDVDPDTPLAELSGMDSVLLLRAIVEIEEACGVAVPDDVLFEAITGRELAGLVSELQGGPR